MEGRVEGRRGKRVEGREGGRRGREWKGEREEGGGREWKGEREEGGGERERGKGHGVRKKENINFEIEGNGNIGRKISWNPVKIHSLHYHSLLRYTFIWPFLHVRPTYINSTSNDTLARAKTGDMRESGETGG